MPNSLEIQSARRNAIRQILEQDPAGTQQSLVEVLISQGFITTQSGVSRDLKEIGAIKTTRGYELAELEKVEEVLEVSEFLREIRTAGPNLLVIKTAIGAAQRVALALDRSDWPEMIGNVGGDDTVLVATKDAGSQRNLLAKIDRASVHI
jgi:transcriptional regulator of arginine metabolism